MAIKSSDCVTSVARSQAVKGSRCARMIARNSALSSGDAVVMRGPGETVKVRQTEEVKYKLNGLLLLIEGTGRNPDTGDAVFNALATISYDDASGVYHFRAYNDGRYLDTELKVPEKGFEWGYKAGPATRPLRDAFERERRVG